MPVLLSTSDLLKSGWTAALIRKLLGDPDEKEPFNRGYMRGTRHWYEKSRVEAAAAQPELAALQERRKARREAPDRRRREFDRRYQNWRGALPDACRYLHSLNRFCKHRACSLQQRAACQRNHAANASDRETTGTANAATAAAITFRPRRCGSTSSASRSGRATPGTSLTDSSPSL